MRLRPRPHKPRRPLSHEEIAELRARARQIGKLLHLAFDEVVHEQVPSDFLVLLGQLEEREKRKSSCH